MKQFLKLYSRQTSLRLLIFFTGMLALLWIPSRSFAQTNSIQEPVTDTTAAPTEEVDATEEEPSLLSPFVSFIGVQKSDKSIDLKAALKTKVNGWPVNLYKMKVRFFQVINEEDIELGFAITDNNGKAVFNLKGDALKTDATGNLQFKMVFAGNKMIESAEETFTFKRARLEINPVKEDSLLTVQIRMIDIGNGTEAPIPDATVGIFVKRLFLPLKVGEGTTDENGEASIEIPNNLSGNGKGEITLLAKVDEDEVFGYLEASSVQSWGIPVSEIIQAQPRALWSKSPPIWMLTTFIILMVTVWGHYIVIIFELFRLRKEEPNTTNN